MDTITTSLIREALATLPSEGAERALALRRAVESFAAREAAQALDAAARLARENALRRVGTPAAKSNGSDTATLLAEMLTAASVLQQDADGLSGPGLEARRTLRRAVAAPAILDMIADWVSELRAIAASAPGTGACTVATALQLWNWTARHFLRRDDCSASALGELASSFTALLAARAQILAVLRYEDPSSAPRQLRIDLCHVQTARAAGTVATLCAELVHGYRRHPAWDAAGCAACYGADELDELEGLMPGIASAARTQTDVVEADGSHAAKAGPCARVSDIEGFTRLRAKLDGCLTGSRLAGDRAAAALAGELAPARQN